MSDEEILSEIKEMAHAATSGEALDWVRSVTATNAQAGAALRSLSVVSVIMANGEAIGLQLPGGRMTPEALEDIQAALLHSALQVSALARAAREQAAARRPAAKEERS